MPGGRIFPHLVEAPVKYMILIHSNPTFLAVWEGLSDAERREFGRGHNALTEQLAASGELVASEGLASPALAKRVSVREGRTITTDGPFAEVKEHLAGFYLIECDSVERAIELAARVPDAAYDEVEVRPVLDLSSLEP
jgi:hypothetical protein